MAVSTPTMYYGKFLGKLHTQQANLILNTRSAKEIENLKHSIFNFNTDLVIESMEKGVSIRSILKSRGEKLDEHIGSLRDYQTVGTAFMYFSPRSILGDFVGLGKTAEIAGLLNLLKSKGEMSRFIMAVETSALAQTRAELIKFTGMNILALPSETAKLRKVINRTDWNNVDGIVIKHTALRTDVLSQWFAVNIKDDGSCNVFDTFILDESSVIKNPETKLYQYTKNICNIAKRVHFLNATTFEKNIMDIYYQMDMMDGNLLPNKTKFQSKFCTFAPNFFWTKRNGKATYQKTYKMSGYKNQAVFKDALGLVYFGRSKEDVGKDLPHIYKIYEVEASKAQIESIEQGFRYMEILNCPSLVKERGIGMTIDEVPKFKRLVDLVTGEFDNNKVMIYCFYIEAQHKIKEELEKYGKTVEILNGETSQEDRWIIQTKFNQGEIDIVITNIQKSLNLYGGDVCIFYSMSTTDSRMTQIAGRIDRNINDNLKTFVLMLYRNTPEYDYFMGTVKTRARDSRDLTIDAKGAVDRFIDSMNIDE